MCCPRDYARFDNSVLAELLRLIGSIPDDIEGDAFGKIYEYFLGNFAMTEGQRGGEFFTPTSIVKLIVDIIEPFQGRILDPACGSGGMFVQSARFVEEHQKNPTNEISIFGQERVDETIRLAKMNLAVHGLGGEIVPSNTYYEDPHDSVGRFDFVIANPPFNVNAIDKDRIKDDKRYPYGIPSIDNGNYLWIQIFSSALNDTGRAGFVMANSASDARHSELAIRRKLIEDRQVDVMVAVGSNFFYTVTLPVTLWFLDKGKRDTDRADQVLFIDARHIFRQIDRAHRDFTPEQHEFLANIVRLYRGEEPEFLHGSEAMLKEQFPDLTYVDVPGLCKIATVDEIESPRLEPQPRPLRRRRRRRRRRLRLRRTLRRADRGVPGADDRGCGARSSDRSTRRCSDLLDVHELTGTTAAWELCVELAVDGVDKTCTEASEYRRRRMSGRPTSDVGGHSTTQRALRRRRDYAELARRASPQAGRHRPRAGGDARSTSAVLRRLDTTVWLQRLVTFDADPTSRRPLPAATALHSLAFGALRAAGLRCDRRAPASRDSSAFQFQLRPCRCSGRSRRCWRRMTS